MYFIDVLAGYDYAINSQNHYAKIEKVYGSNRGQVAGAIAILSNPRGRINCSLLVIDKSCAAELDRKLAVFAERTKIRKSLFLTIITTYSVKK